MKGRKTSGKRMRLKSDRAVYTRLAVSGASPASEKVPMAATPMRTGAAKRSTPKVAEILDTVQMVSTSWLRMSATRLLNAVSQA